jgi:hypothetical protein
MQRLLLIALAIVTLSAFDARAQESEHPGRVRPDDRVMFDLSAEDWVTTKTAHVTATVEAAVTAGTAGATRAEMTKVVNDLAKADWRLTSFDRSQDQTGMERWSATFEARLPENDLGGLNETAKKLSKAGLQLTIADIDFSPTLEETEAVRGTLRAQIYKIANDQLAVLNAALPGRNYRIALVNFTGTGDDTVPMPQVVRGRLAAPMAATAMIAPEPPPQIAPPLERAEKVSLTARVIFAATPERVPEGKPAPTPAEMKR